jgi:tetratricopeptide (TPR) repeat protein
MAPSNTDNDLYTVLGVTHGESHEGIKRAYHQFQKRLIKQNEPEALQKIKQAYDILADASARKQYDAIWDAGGEVRTLLGKAIGAIEEGNHIGASRYLGEVISLKPSADLARDLMGICLVELGLMDEAVRTYETLVERQPDVPLYWLHSGDLYLDLASKAGKENKPMLGSARNNYRRAFMLNPQRKAPYISLAKTYYKEKKYNQALSWVEKAISKIGKPDYEDFDSLFYMLRILAMAGDEKRVIDATSKVEKFSFKDEDLNKYVASLYVKTANDIIKIKFYKAAKHFLTNALRHNPNNPELDKLQRKVDSIIGAEGSWKNLEAEVAIIKPIKTLAALLLVYSCGNKTEEEYEKAVKSIRSKIAEFPADKVTTGIEILQYRYNPYYDFDPQLWNSIVNSLTPGLKGKAAYTTGYTGSGRKPALSGKGPISDEPSIGAAKAKQAEEIVVKATDWSPLAGAILGIILAAIGYFVIPVHLVGMFAGAILGWYVGSAVGRLM